MLLITPMSGLEFREFTDSLLLVGILPNMYTETHLQPIQVGIHNRGYHQHCFSLYSHDSANEHYVRITN